MRPELFLAMRLPMPSITSQRKAVGMLRRMNAARSASVATDAALAALLPAVLRQGFAGALAAEDAPSATKAWGATPREAAE